MGQLQNEKGILDIGYNNICCMIRNSVADSDEKIQE